MYHPHVDNQCGSHGEVGVALFVFQVADVVVDKFVGLVESEHEHGTERDSSPSGEFFVEVVANPAEAHRPCRFAFHAFSGVLGNGELVAIAEAHRHERAACQRKAVRITGLVAVAHQLHPAVVNVENTFVLGKNTAHQ